MESKGYCHFVTHEGDYRREGEPCAVRWRWSAYCWDREAEEHVCIGSGYEWTREEALLRAMIAVGVHAERRERENGEGDAGL